MKEVVLLDESGKIVGRSEKMKAHAEGLYHLAYSVMIVNFEGDILLQKRAKRKYHSGGKWSNACCSHPDSDALERIVEQAQSRLREEMGFSCPLRRLTEFSYRAEVEDLIENERDTVLIGTYDGVVSPNPEEADGYQWISKNELYARLKQSPEEFSPWFRIMAEMIEREL